MILREIFRFCFEWLTDPLSLSLNPLAELLVLAIINELVYRFAFRMVGDFYRLDFINGQFEGSFFHWTIRTILFYAIWVLTNLVITEYHFVVAHCLAVVGALLLVVIIFLIYNYFWKQETAC